MRKVKNENIFEQRMLVLILDFENNFCTVDSRLSYYYSVILVWH